MADQVQTTRPNLPFIFPGSLFCTACRANVMRAFLFTTCFAHTNRHDVQRIVGTTLGTACFTGFTSWRCHFLILFIFTFFYFIYFPCICKENFTPPRIRPMFTTTDAGS